MRMRACRAFMYVLLSSVFVAFIAGAWSSHRWHEFVLMDADALGVELGSAKLSTILGQFTNLLSEEKGNGCLARLDELHGRLTEVHPVLLSGGTVPPLTIKTGGLQGSISLLYGSLFEFLAVYHAPFQTTGNTGRHFMNTSVHVLSGEVKVWYAGARKKAVYGAGKKYKLRIGQKAVVGINEDTCLLLYGKGLVPMTMWYWISDSLLSSFDLASVAHIIFYYFKAVYESSWSAFKIPWDSLMQPWDFLSAAADDGLLKLPGLWEDSLFIFSSLTYTIHDFLSSLIPNFRTAVVD